MPSPGPPMYIIHVYLSLLTQAENQVEGGLLLDVVVGKCATVLQLFSGEDKPLLVRGNALLVLDLLLDALNRVG